MSDGDTTELKIHIVSDADGKGFQQTADSTKQLVSATDDASDSIKNLGNREGEEGAQTEKIEGLHRGLHSILHLIGVGAGPEAEAALASIAALGVGSGGFLLLVAALGSVVEALRQGTEQAEKMREAAREALVELQNQTDTANESIIKLSDSYKQFWDNLKRTGASKEDQDAFNLQIQQLKDLGRAADAAGVGNKAVNDANVDSAINAAKTARAQALEDNTGSLSAQLKRLQGETTSAGAQKDDLELEQLKADKQKLEDAYKNGSAYRPLSRPISSTTAPLMNSDFDSTDNGAGRKASFEANETAITKEIKAREDASKAIQDHVKVLEDTIATMTREAQALRASVASDQSSGAADVFEQGKKVADALASGNGVSAAQADFLVVLERNITGHKLTVENAAKLIEMQSANEQTLLLLITAHAAKIAQLQGQIKSISYSTQ